MGRGTVDREIFVGTLRRRKLTIFQDRTKLQFRYAEATKIKQRENLTDEYFFTSEDFPIYGMLWEYNFVHPY